MRHYRAGDSLDDVCRACKLDRVHTAIVVTPDGYPLRVQCDFCGSQHNYRGGARDEQASSPRTAPAAERPRAVSLNGPLPPVSERERVGDTTVAIDTEGGPVDLELLLRRIIREETGLTPAVPAEKWRGGTVVLKPANQSLQEKSWPVDTLFHKIVMIRNRLRTLEQQVNGMDLPEDVKVKLQGYITGCYGSLTSFNVLFADEADQFKGSGGD